MTAITSFGTKRTGRGFHFFPVKVKAPPSSKAQKNTAMNKAKVSTLLATLILKMKTK